MLSILISVLIFLLSLLLARAAGPLLHVEGTPLLILRVLLVALGLAATGLGASILASVSESTKEIGIRKVMSICAALGLELLAQEKTRRPTLQQLMNEPDDA